MKALLCRELGAIDALRVEDVASPRPATGQVLIDVKASAANFPDVLMVEGKYQFKPPMPFAPGCEVAGHVTEVGADVTRTTRSMTAPRWLPAKRCSCSEPPAAWASPRWSSAARWARA